MLPEKQKNQFRELVGIFFLAFAIFYAVSLWSYRAADPSINTVTPQDKVHNYGGIVGSYLADVSLQTWGVAAIWFVLLAFMLAIFCFRGRLPLKPVRSMIGYVMLIIATASGFSLTWRELPYGGGLLLPGGFFGQICAQKLSFYLNATGAYIAVTWCLTTGFLLVTKMSVSAVWHFCSLILAGHRPTFSGLSERLKEWKKRRVAEENRSFTSTTPSTEYQGGFPSLDEEGNFPIPASIPPSIAASESFSPSAKKSTLLERLRKKWKRTPSSPPPSFHSTEQTTQNLKERLMARKALLKNIPTPEKPRGSFKLLAHKEEELTVKKKGPIPQPSDFKLPSLGFLRDPPSEISRGNDEHSYRDIAAKLQQTLQEFSVRGQIVGIQPGPVITMYEFEPAPGIKINKIATLENDLALALSALSVRIVAPIPGKSVIGFEIPNAKRAHVYLKELISNDRFATFDGILPVVLGKDIAGYPVIADIAKMPHLLIAGATGAGKSVFVNALICCLLYRFTPIQIRFLLIDPKMLEFAAYEGIPNLMMPVITNAKRASLALQWLVREMERRYDTMSKVGARNIEIYNKVIEGKAARAARMQKKDFVPFEKMPYIIVVIDELADLMMVASKDVELSITRLAQMARASGIHMIVATQRPSVDVITGIIKANFPARISFQVSSKIDSRTILDTMGAESLLGFGDMLFLPPGTSKLQRIHGAYVADSEINRIVEYLANQGSPLYGPELLEQLVENKAREENFDEIDDEFYSQAVAMVAQTRQASISMIQRRFRIGYNRAARLIERMEEEGLVGNADGSKPRRVLISSLDI
ncbi:MAG: DNA translocase FtsK 4TM domain-containing protein [Deltaproteobacteria bacterium]|nr:DNA translocase FtsK 4TM domain-containing protein [Deltaproteobacteria bacterium]